jgi:carbon storage regulator
MLILTRGVGETVRVGDDITVTVIGIKGKGVRLGIITPKDVDVRREEIFDNTQIGEAPTRK